MKNSKIYPLSKLWLLLSSLWLVIIVSGIWIFGPALEMQNIRPLEGAYNRLYVIISFSLLWLTAVLYCLTRHKKLNAKDEQDTESEPEEPHSLPILEALYLIQANKKVWAIEKKSLHIIIPLEFSEENNLIEQIYMQGETENISLESYKSVKQVRLTYNKNIIYIESWITKLQKINTNKLDLCSALLSLVAKHRKLTPVNSVVFSTNYQSIIDPLQWQNTHATIIDIAELMRDKLGYIPPIDILLTDAENITGFQQYFQNISDPQRNALLGARVEVSEAMDLQTYRKDFIEHFKALQRELESQIFERIQQTSDQSARDAIFRFPARFSIFRNMLTFSIEQLAISLFRLGALPPRTITLVSTKNEHTIFLKNFLRLLRADSSVAERISILRKRRLKRWLIMASIVGILLTISLAFWLTILQISERHFSSLISKLQSVEHVLISINNNPPTSANISEIVAPLIVTRQLIDEYESSYYNNLVSNKQFIKNLRSAHSHLSYEYLLPRIIYTLESKLRSKDKNDAELNYIFDALALYQHLFGQLELNQADQRQLIQYVFSNNDTDGSNQKQYIDELIWLFNNKKPKNTPDIELITQARIHLSMLSTGSRTLHLLSNAAKAAKIDDWRISDTLITPNHGQDNTVSIPSLYTQQGFQMVLVPHFSDALHQVINTKSVWLNRADITTANLARDSLNAYASRFNQLWTSYLSGVQLKLPDNIDEADLYQDQLLQLVMNIVKKTTLIPANTAPDSDFSLANMASLWKEKIPYSNLRTIINDDTQKDRLQQLTHNLSTTLDLILKYPSQASNAYNTPQSGVITNDKLVEDLQKLHELTAQLPYPLRQWMAQLAENIQPELRLAISRYLSEQWHKQNINICQKLTENRYPFSHKASSEITIEDFMRLFGPDGIFAKFTDEYLKLYIDSSSTPWTWRYTDMAALLSQKSLEMFEQAFQIRNSFFPADQKTPMFSINIKANTLSGKVQAAIMEVEGNSITLSHNQTDAAAFSWPSTSTDRISKLVIFSNDWHQIANASGSWSFFRLIEQGKIETSTGGQLNIIFGTQGNTASFLLDLSEDFPMFRNNILSNFKCQDLNLQIN